MAIVEKTQKHRSATKDNTHDNFGVESKSKTIHTCICMYNYRYIYKKKNNIISIIYSWILTTYWPIQLNFVQVKPHWHIQQWNHSEGKFGPVVPVLGSNSYSGYFLGLVSRPIFPTSKRTFYPFAKGEKDKWESWS